MNLVDRCYPAKIHTLIGFRPFLTYLNDLPQEMRASFSSMIAYCELDV